MASHPEIQHQLTLELYAIELGIKKYRDKLQNSEPTDLPPGIRLTQMSLEPFTRKLVEYIEGDSACYAGGYRSFYRKLSPEVVAFLTINRIINSIAATRPESVQNIALDIADRLLTQIDYEEFKKTAPGYVYIIEQDNKWASESHRRATIMRAQKKLLGRTQISREHKLKIGMRLVDIFIESTGFAEKVLAPNPDKPTGHGAYTLVPTKEVEEWITKSHGECELLRPVHFPMVVPPRDWTSPFGGGFISNHISLQVPVVKHENPSVQLALAEQDLGNVYHALNTIQRTPYRINQVVLSAIELVWAAGGGHAGLPKREVELPPKPWPEGEEPELDVLISWKKASTSAHERHARDRSKRVAVAIKLMIAKEMAFESKIYFCWNLDWRGRMYPLQPFVNPQADDSGRALLEFAQAVELGPDGLRWLKIHGANCWGLDKFSFDERVAWVEEAERMILSVADAENAMDAVHLWGVAEKPFHFLAFCHEYAAAIRSPDASKYKSRLIVSVDGSCNGLQNFSAMLRDKVGGAAVNLVPSERPSDVYMMVADKVDAKVRIEAAAGNKHAIAWTGKVTRKVVKRGVMTTPYGVTKYGLKKQLQIECDKIDRDYLSLPEGEKPGQYYAYLAGHLYEAIGEVVIAARQAMDWLQEVCNILTENGKDVSWTTPVGFRPVQAYRKRKLTRVNTLYGGVRTSYGLSTNTEKLDRRRMKDGIAPNFVHSLDAAHCMWTIIMAETVGVTQFSMVHDSYGTHAGNMHKLTRILRIAFIDIYKEPLLHQLREELQKQLPEGVVLPEPPPFGELDLNQILWSPYFFG